MTKKVIQEKNFEDNKEFVIENDVEQDPNVKNNHDSGEDNDND